MAPRAKKNPRQRVFYFASLKPRSGGVPAVKCVGASVGTETSLQVLRTWNDSIGGRQFPLNSHVTCTHIMLLSHAQIFTSNRRPPRSRSETGSPRKTAHSRWP